MAEDGAAVVYTTHYLPEVEALDADLVIIDDGAMLGRGTQKELIDAHDLDGLQFRFDGELPAALEVLAPSPLGDDAYLLQGSVGMIDLLQALGPDSDRLVSVESLRPDLEAVFLAMTGHGLGSPEVSA